MRCWVMLSIVLLIRVTTYGEDDFFPNNNHEANIEKKKCSIIYREFLTWSEKYDMYRLSLCGPNCLKHSMAEGHEISRSYGNLGTVAKYTSREIERDFTTEKNYLEEKKKLEECILAVKKSLELRKEEVKNKTANVERLKSLSWEDILEEEKIYIVDRKSVV